MGEVLTLLDRYGIGLVVVAFVLFAGVMAVRCLFGKNGLAQKVGSKHVEFLESVKSTNEVQARAASQSAQAQIATAAVTHAMQQDIHILKASHGAIRACGLSACELLDHVADKMDLCDEARDHIANIRATINAHERAHPGQTV